MEIETSTPPVIAKNLWHIVKVLFYMLRKGISKTKLFLDLHPILKSGNLAGKLLTNLMLKYDYSFLTCRSNSRKMSFVSPLEYEFSCSNSPVYPSFYAMHRYNHHHHRYSHHNVEDINNAVHKVFDILNNNYEAVDASPFTMLPGFGQSPMVRQLRITDSPFPVKDSTEGDAQVDKAAEEFINKFYKVLKQEKKMAAALESPSPFHKWGR